MTQCTVGEKGFGMFLIHRLAERWGKPVPETYLILNNTGILDGKKEVGWAEQIRLKVVDYINCAKEIRH